MIDFKELELSDITPENLMRDETVKNTTKVISNRLSGLYTHAYKLNYTMNLRDLPEEVIDHLLWEAHLYKPAEGLMLARTLEEKVNLLEAATELHIYKGTPYAIERALEVVGLDGRNEEWFEYDGEPYHFWIELKLNQKLNDLDMIRELVAEYKNVRSWFDGFVIMALEQGFLYWDDSYSYPVYFETCNDFWGKARAINTSVGGTKYADDSYSYPVYFDVNTILFKNVDVGKSAFVNDSYSYPVYYESCGDFETPDTTSVQFDGAVDMIFEAYSYPAYYQVCGEFEAGG